MVRTTQKRKRSGFNSARAFKKRRVSRRRGKNSTSYSTKAGAATGLRFKTKRLSRRAYNKKLWDSTFMKAHYRSNGSVAGNITSQALQGNITITTLQAMDNGSAPFWQTNGGAQTIDVGVGVPVFADDIVVRGGMVGIKLFNENGALGETATVQCKVYLIKNAPRQDLTNLPTSAPYGWDPTLVPEFSKDIGTVIYTKTFQLENVNEMTIERRIGVMKIDQQSWSADVQRLSWIVTVGDPQGTVSKIVRVCTYFNLSFSADAVGAA